MCVAQPFVRFECERMLRTGHRADTRQTWWRSAVESCVLPVPCLLNEWSSLANLWTSGARRLLSERVWNSLVVVTRSHVWKTACDCLCISGGQRQLNCGNSLNSRLWRAIRLGPNGRCSASVATAGTIRPKTNSNDFGGFWNLSGDSNSIFVVAKFFFFERFEFLVRSCECAVPRLCPRISISNVVVFVTIHDDMFLYVHIYKRCLPK